MPAAGSSAFGLPGTPFSSPGGFSWRLEQTRNGSIYYFVVHDDDHLTPSPTFGGWYALTADFGSGSVPSFSSAVHLANTDSDHNLEVAFFMADTNGLLWNATSGDSDISVVGPVLRAWDALSGTQIFSFGCSAPTNSTVYGLTTFEDTAIPYVASLIHDNAATPDVFYLNVNNAATGALVAALAMPSATRVMPYVLSDGIGYIYACGYSFSADEYNISSAYIAKISLLSGSIVATLPLTVGGTGPNGMIMNRSNGQILLDFTNGSFSGTGDIRTIDSINLIELGTYSGLCASFMRTQLLIPNWFNEIHFPLTHHDAVTGPAVDCPRGEFTVASPKSGSTGNITRIGLQNAVPLVLIVDTVAGAQFGTQNNAWGYPFNYMTWNPFIEGFIGCTGIASNNIGAAMTYDPYTTGSCGANPCTGADLVEFR